MVVYFICIFTFRIIFLKCIHRRQHDVYRDLVVILICLLSGFLFLSLIVHTDDKEAHGSINAIVHVKLQSKENTHQIYCSGLGGPAKFSHRPETKKKSKYRITAQMSTYKDMRVSTPGLADLACNCRVLLDQITWWNE